MRGAWFRARVPAHRAAVAGILCAFCGAGQRYIGLMKSTRFLLVALAFLCIGTVVAAAEERAFDPELAKRLGADERGMKM